MMEPVRDEVYKMVLDNLHVTHEVDESTERRIKNEISSGISYIKKYCNPRADFAPGTQFGGMLCEYVLRAESGAAETFYGDFSEEITATRMEHETQEYAEAMGYA
ncbi:MAG: hypothetical protein HFG99_11430 [Dorea sp.]|jgi:hypothetical protein|nr:hypothetical protein [Dorea sp.]MCI9249728.1 hypothetical protein [Dorea sp.]